MGPVFVKQLLPSIQHASCGRPSEPHSGSTVHTLASNDAWLLLIGRAQCRVQVQLQNLQMHLVHAPIAASFCPLH